MLKNFGIEILLILLVFLVMEISFPLQKLGGTVGELFRHLLVFITVATLGVALILWKIRSHISVLMKIWHHLEGPGRGPLMVFVRDWVQQINLTMNALLTPGGALLRRDEVARLIRLLFRLGKGLYNGTDSNIPSRFLQLYPSYLAYHQENLEKQHKPGIRILIVEEKELRRDYAQNKQDVNQFINWHTKNGTLPLQIEPEIARQISSEKLLGATDIGIWDKDHGAVFVPEPETQMVRIAFIQADDSRFLSCIAYFRELCRKANRIMLTETTIACSARSETEIEADMERIGYLE